MKLVVLLVLATATASAAPAGYAHKLGIGVENGGDALSDYQVRLEINTRALIATGQLRADAADLVFTSADCADTVLPHFIESGLDTTKTVVWVKVPALAAATTTQITMWHGNPEATENTSDATRVFIGGDQGQPISATNLPMNGPGVGVTMMPNSQRGFRFSPKTPLLVMQFGKNEPIGSTRTMTLFDGATQSILHQRTVAGPVDAYSYADLTQPVWLEANHEYLIEMYQGADESYYYGGTPTVSEDLTYIGMRFCNGCGPNVFPTNTIPTEMHYGYVNFTYFKRQVASPEPVQVAATTACVESETCDSDCSAVACGDQRMNAAAGEECDDGNENDNDACTSACQAATCGDGFVYLGVEMCDDGNQVDTDACRNNCGPASCGDGVVQEDEEMCDDANAIDTDACRNNCAAARCGDGVLQGGVETCDDGNTVDTDGCRATCVPASCGDGVVAAGSEDCDDGNTIDTDACRNDCTTARCGDGVVQAGTEACDDGNRVETDACTSACVAATCGDGIVEAGVEECEDGNSVDGDGCETDCTFTPDEAGCCSTGRQTPRELAGFGVLALAVLTSLRRRRR